MFSAVLWGVVKWVVDTILIVIALPLVLMYAGCLLMWHWLRGRE